jgi:hypothetical protein
MNMCVLNIQKRQDSQAELWADLISLLPGLNPAVYQAGDKIILSLPIDRQAYEEYEKDPPPGMFVDKIKLDAE